MKNLYSLMAACVIASSSSLCAQEIITFKAAGAPRYHEYNGTVVELNSGFSCSTPRNATQQAPVTTLSKAMVSDYVMVDEVVLTKEDGTELTGTGNHVENGSFHLYPGNALRITVAAGMKVMSLKVTTIAPSSNRLLSFVEVNDAGEIAVRSGSGQFKKESGSSIQTWSTSTGFDGTVNLYPTGTPFDMKIFSMEFTVIRSKTNDDNQVSIPRLSVTDPMIPEGSMVELTCPTEGARIHYTVTTDGTTEMPTEESPLYEGPFRVDGNAVVRAIAVKEGWADSFPIYQEIYAMPKYTGVAKFDFNDHTTLKNANGELIAGFASYPKLSDETKTQEEIRIAPNTIVDNGVILEPTSVAGSNIVLLKSLGYVVRYNYSTNAKVTIKAPEGKYIKGIVIDGSAVDKIGLSNTAGTLARSDINGSRLIYRPDPANESGSVVLQTAASPQYLDKMYVCYGDKVVSTGIDDIVNDTDAPVEYFNMQGMRVTDPSPGLYIIRKGGKASKIMIR